MDPRSWWKHLPKLFDPKTNEVVESPNLYVKLTTRCMEQVEGVVGVNSASILNQAQCQYLVEKLKLTLQSANLVIGQVNEEFFSLASPEDMEQLLLIFKLLYAMGKEIENFIQDCCKETWIPSAIMLTNVSKHVITIGFNLECCSIIFSKKNLEASTSLGLGEIASLQKFEADVVRERANCDKTSMIASLQVALQSIASHGAEHELASYLLRKLEPTHTSVSLVESNVRRSLQMQGQVGVGTSAIVYKAIWYGLEVAMKSYNGPENTDFLNEVKLLEGLSHPNIVSILWYTTTSRRCHLIMELMDGDLNHLIAKKMEESGQEGYPFSIPEALHLMLQIAEGMLYLHEKGIVHRDLKSSNILIRSTVADKVDTNNYQAKVADFGLARTKEINVSYSNLTPNVGTTRWMAPEVIGIGSDEFERKVGSKYPFKVDIYSYAMVCYEILSGDLPFSTLNNGDAKKAIIAGKRPLIPTNCPQRVKSLIEACWKSKASTRPCFSNICEELRATKISTINNYWVASTSKCSSKDKVVKEGDNDQTCILEQGAINDLLASLLSPNEKTYMDAITTLLNLSYKNNRVQIIAAGVIEPILKVLNMGGTKARECVATILFNLCLDDENKFTIGNSGAIPALVTLLQDATTEGKKVVANTLMSLFNYGGCKRQAIQAGVVPHLMRLILNQPAIIFDEALALLAILATVQEGCDAIATIAPKSTWNKIIVLGSPQSKERASTILFAVSSYDTSYIKKARKPNVQKSQKCSKLEVGSSKKQPKAFKKIEQRSEKWLCCCRQWFCPHCNPM